MRHPDLLTISKLALTTHLTQWSAPVICVDGTMGNGHDTLFLARHAGATGMVYGFDIQPQALEATTTRLRDADLLGRTTLALAGHETMADVINPDHQGQVAAAMFNLGYLPGSDKQVVTLPHSTRQALDALQVLLAPGGLISVMAYTRHPGGKDEEDMVRAWCAEKDRTKWRVFQYAEINKPEGAEVLYLISLRSR